MAEKDVKEAEKGRPDDDEDDDFEIVEQKPDDEEDEDDEDEGSEKSEDDGEAEEAAEKDESDDEEEARREALRERRRREKRERRAAQKEAIERNKREVADLKRQLREMQEALAGVNQVNLRREAQDIDARMSIEARRFAEAEAAIRDATARNDGDLLTRALRQRDDARAKHAELAQVKNRISQAPPPQAQQSQQLSKRAADMAKSFMDEHPWFDPSGKDEDSVIVTALDNKIVSEGYQPDDEEYWDELRRRVKARLPHKFRAEPKRKAPPTSGGRDVPQTVRKQIYVSPERKKAMQDAGIWDDPVARKQMLKRYAEYDKNNPSR
jgi:hypothetical protein